MERVGCERRNGRDVPFLASIRFSWGDGDTSAWSALVPSGATATMSHSWRSIGTYQVKAQAKDEEGLLSGWSSSWSFNVSPPLKWRYQTGGDVYSSPAIGSDGTVYVGSYDNCLYAIQGSGTLANTPWPKFRHDLRSTGRVGGP